MIVDPWGRILDKCRGLDDEESLKRVKDGSVGGEEGDVEICIAEVDLGLVERIRKEMPMRRRL